MSSTLPEGKDYDLSYEFTDPKTGVNFKLAETLSDSARKQAFKSLPTLRNHFLSKFGHPNGHWADNLVLEYEDLGLGWSDVLNKKEVYKRMCLQLSQTRELRFRNKIANVVLHADSKTESGAYETVKECQTSTDSHKRRTEYAETKLREKATALAPPPGFGDNLGSTLNVVTDDFNRLKVTQNGIMPTSEFAARPNFQQKQTHQEKLADDELHDDLCDDQAGSYHTSSEISAEKQADSSKHSSSSKSEYEDGDIRVNYTSNMREDFNRESAPLQDRFDDQDTTYNHSPATPPSEVVDKLNDHGWGDSPEDTPSKSEKVDVDDFTSEFAQNNVSGYDSGWNTERKDYNNEQEPDAQQTSYSDQFSEVHPSRRLNFEQGPSRRINEKDREDYSRNDNSYSRRNCSTNYHSERRYGKNDNDSSVRENELNDYRRKSENRQRDAGNGSYERRRFEDRNENRSKIFFDSSGRRRSNENIREDNGFQTRPFNNYDAKGMSFEKIDGRDLAENLVSKWHSNQEDNHIVTVENKAKAVRSKTYTEERDFDLEKVLFAAPSTTGSHFNEYDQNPVHVAGPNPPKQMSSFSDTIGEHKIHPHVLENIRMCQYKTPTPIQKIGIPIVLNRRDLIACAITGSGKTASFLVPAISIALKNKWHQANCVDSSRRVLPIILIVAPTRELSCQIFDEARKFTYRTGIRPCVAYGGAPVYPQLDDMVEGCHLLVCTPGRLIDFVQRGRMSLSRVKILILDEADRMLELGFEESIRKLIKGTDMSSARQTIMYSATFPRRIQELATEYLRQGYLHLVVGGDNVACQNIEQEIIPVASFEKRDKLLSILKGLNRQRVLIFVQTKRDAMSLDDFLLNQGYPSTSIHGDRSQLQREASLMAFRNGKRPILVATSVAARGLDIPSVNLIVVFDMPQNTDEYIHKIGRTARAGHDGKAIVFFTSDDAPVASGLLGILKNSGQKIPEFLTEFAAGADSYQQHTYFDMNKDIRRDHYSYERKREFKFDQRREFIEERQPAAKNDHGW